MRVDTARGATGRQMLQAPWATVQPLTFNEWGVEVAESNTCVHKITLISVVRPD